MPHCSECWPGVRILTGSSGKPTVSGGAECDLMFEVEAMHIGGATIATVGENRIQ